MKKVLSLVITAILVLATSFATVGCSELESGSKIQRMTMVLEYTDADGNSVERNVEIKLYLNYAPLTTARFIELAEKGYYNGLCISNVQSNWLEFGAYKSVDGKLQRTDGDVETLRGEFSKNGWIGNPLVCASGSLIMKRDYSLDTNTDQVYNSAKASVIVALGSISKFKSSDYCIFGKIVSDDESYTVTDSEDSSTVSKTSLDACKELTSLNQTEDGVKTYYYENYAEGRKYNDDSEFECAPYYCSKYDEEEGVTKYYKGAAVDAENEVKDEELDDLKDLMSEESYAFFILPYNTVTIKSISKKN